MAMIKINDNPSNRELRQFSGVWFPMFWLVVAGMMYFVVASPRLAVAAALFGVVVGAIGVGRPAFSHPIYLIWMYAVYPIGWTISHVLLAAIFYLLVTPIGLVMKLVRYDPLQRHMRGDETTFWTRCEPVTTETHYFRQF